MKKLRAPSNGHFNIKRVCKPRDHKRQMSNLSRVQMASAPNERVGDISGVNIWYRPGGATATDLKALVSVDNTSGSHGVSWGQFGGPRILLKKAGGGLASDNEGDQDLTEIKWALTSVAYIWLGLTSVGIYCGATVKSCGSGKILLAWYRRLLEIFYQGPCQFGLFGSGSTSIVDGDNLDQIHGEDMPCGYIESH